jgi:hypothetical protein
MPTRFWKGKKRGEFPQQSHRFLSTAPVDLVFRRPRCCADVCAWAASPPALQLSPLHCHVCTFASRTLTSLSSLHAPALLVLHVFIGPIARFSVFYLTRHAHSVFFIAPTSHRILFPVLYTSLLFQLGCGRRCAAVFECCRSPLIALCRRSVWICMSATSTHIAVDTSVPFRWAHLRTAPR